MPDDSFIPPTLRERQPGKLANTGITNEIVRAIKGITPQISGGILDDPRLSARIASVVITGNVENQTGRYTGNAYRWIHVKSDATGNLSQDDFGDQETDDNCVVWHMPEIVIGNPKPMLDTGTIYDCRYAGHNKDGKIIFTLGALAVGMVSDPVDCTLGTGSSADTASWDRGGDNGDTAGVLIPIYRYACVSGTLTEFKRTMTVDACGNVVSISAES